MIYDIYHDESKAEAYWHGFLFVPKKSRNEVLNILKKALIDTKTEENYDFSFKNLSKNKIEVANLFLSTLKSSLQQFDNGKMEEFKTKKTYCKTFGINEFNSGTFSASPKFKVSIFHQKNNFKDMGNNDKLENIETTFRMGLQGAKNYLFKDENIFIDKIYLDGFVHYKKEHGREINKEKIKNDLIIGVKENINFTDDFDIIDGKETNEDKIFIDLIDIFLGTFRLNYLIEGGNKEYIGDYRHCLWNIFRDFPKKAIIKNSRFYKFGTFSSSWIENDNWQFENIFHKSKSKRVKHNENALTLF